MVMMKRIFVAAAMAFLALPVMAEDSKAVQSLKKDLVKIFGGQPESIQAAPIDGLYEVIYGPKLYYVSLDGRYLLSGDLFDLKTRTNLTEKNRSDARLKTMAKVDESEMIIYKAKGEEKHTVTVFTDIDCGYCRKLHQGMAEMNDLGITVRYLAYPRAGVGSSAYDKAEGVWCAKDRHKAMDKAKSGATPPKANCETPVKAHLALGATVGVTGTPALVLDDGTLMPGYLPPQKLAAALAQSGN
jgi:thiol:disulfide interchange protein DsbC